MDAEKLESYQKLFGCKFEHAQEVFPACVAEAESKFSEAGVKAYIESAGFLCRLGMGVEPVLVYLEEMPALGEYLGESVFELIAKWSYQHLIRTPNKKAIIPFLQSLGSVCRRIDRIEDLQHYLDLIDQLVAGTENVIHSHSIYESPGLIPFLESMPQLIGRLSLHGMSNFIQYGARNYKDAPEEQIAYFSLKSQDARSIIQRERQGTLFKDIERHLNMMKEALWGCEHPFSSFATAFDQERIPEPYIDDELIAVPDVCEGENGVSGKDQYRAMLAHMMGHWQWSQKVMADNFAPHTQFFISVFEDCRIDRLLMARFPGLKPIFLALHPVPEKGACHPEKMSCMRYRAARLSRALMDEDFDPENALIEALRAQFNQILAEKGEASSINDMVKLGTDFYVKSRQPSDSLPNLFFDQTEIHYRDDNRYLWFHYDEDDGEDQMPNEYQSEEKLVEDSDSLPPRHYDEWDYLSETYRPDWATVYERLQPAGEARQVDRLLEKHTGLIKQLKKMIEALKPQNKKRIRFQEEGEELDLDVALRALIDLKSGSVPDPRINYSHITDSRDIAVTVLVDMSQSLNERVEGSGQTLLELSKEALAIMTWVVDQLGDRLAIAGFNSDTRHEVRFHHIKGFSEHYEEEVKARIASIDAEFSTRMGAAMRHAAHYLAAQPAEKKLMLILTDGEPADIDVKDPRLLIEDSKVAVKELQQEGIYSYCINMDPKADEYVSDIFGSHYTIIDHVEQLPEKLPKVFMNITK